MGDKDLHLAQARHNKMLAEYLVSNEIAGVSYHDWGITAAFYTAIHIVEAFFYTRPEIVHSETSIPLDDDGEPRHTAHSWRAQKLRECSTKAAWSAFRKLKLASEQARYLSGSQLGAAAGASGSFLTAPAADYFTSRTAKMIVSDNLKQLSWELFQGRA